MNDEYFQRKQEQRDKLAAIVDGLAKALNWPATEVSDDGWWHAKLLCPTAGTVYVAANFIKGSIRVTGDWPRNSKGETFVPNRYNGAEARDISFSMEKTPVQMANDIRRRFLPVYQASWDLLKKRADDSDDYYAKKLDLARTFAIAAAAKEPTECRGTIFVRGKHCEIEVRSATSFVIKHEDLNPDQALRLIDFLNNL